MSNKAKKEPVRVLVLSGFGLNCDVETAYAFKLAGALSERVHVNALISKEVSLNDYHILVFDGGFSWGDDHGAGVLAAVRLKYNIGDALHEFIEDGKLVLGICNGFQVLVNLGFLPGFDGDYKKRLVALTCNDCGNFRDDWVSLLANPESPCIFTRGIGQLELPVRHGEGKFYASPETIQHLVNEKQVVLQYAAPDGAVAHGKFPYNPNGSVLDIAGICDPTGRVFGLMPHPEAYNHWTNHPDWARIKVRSMREGKSFAEEDTVGTKIFKNAVSFMSG
jgi:phosphoribosylformylglycinamidine synthase subunit PurQ / glutaminase